MSRRDILSCTYNIKSDGAADQIDWQSVSKSLEGDDWRWIHLDRHDDTSRGWLYKDSGLCRNTVDALLTTQTRPRCVTTEEGTLLILHDASPDEGERSADMGTVRVWIESNRVITVSCQVLDTIRELRRSCVSNTAPSSPADLVLRLADSLTERMGEVLATIDEEVDELEDVQDTAEIAALRKRVVAVRHQLIPLRRFFLPQRDALSDLHAANGIGLNDWQLRRMHEVADHMTRYVEDLAATRESLCIIHEAIANRNAEHLNQIMLILTIAGAIFLPLGFFAGLLGINVGGIPGAHASDAFWIVTLLMVAVGVAELAIFRRLRWI